MEKLVKWITKNKREFFILLAILLVAAVLRLWNIDGYLDFKGDEGRDMRVVRRLIVDFDPILIGPRTSIGDMYLGPLYYYLIAPSLLLSGLSPVGPAVFVALLGVATVGLVWFVGREWFGKVAGFTAAGLYAVSPVVVENTRDSWNPNIMPFFALVSVYALWRVWEKKEWKWLLVLGVAYAFVLQSHYLGLLLLPTIGLVWLGSWWQSRNLLKHSLAGLLIFLFLMSPLVIFDARHGWRNFQAMARFFAERQTTVSAKPWNAIPELWPLWNENVTERLLTGKSEQYAPLVAATLLLGVVWLGSRRPLGLTVLWLLAGLVGLGVYKQAIYDHYFGFLFPAPFLLVGAVLQGLWDKKLRWLAIAIPAALVWINLQNNPIQYPQNRELERVQTVDKKILEESGGEAFNFALIAKRNYEEGYLYFFELWGAPVREIDSQKADETITEQLFVVCEDRPTPEEPEPCKPINHPKAEIANFGWAKIADEQEIAGVKLFKLVHTEQ